jgi:hypothetical protein
MDVRVQRCELAFDLIQRKFQIGGGRDGHFPYLGSGRLIRSCLAQPAASRRAKEQEH